MKQTIDFGFYNPKNFNFRFGKATVINNLSNPETNFINVKCKEKPYFIRVSLIVSPSGEIEYNLTLKFDDAMRRTEIHQILNTFDDVYLGYYKNNIWIQCERNLWSDFGNSYVIIEENKYKINRAITKLSKVETKNDEKPLKFKFDYFKRFLLNSKLMKYEFDKKGIENAITFLKNGIDGFYKKSHWEILTKGGKKTPTNLEILELANKLDD